MADERHAKHQPLVEETDDRDRLRAAEELLAAIGSDKVDGFVVRTPSGDRVVLTDRGVERPYRAMVDGMSEGALTLAPDGTILYANARLAEMVGARLDGIVGSNFYDLVDAETCSLLGTGLHGEVGEPWRGEVLMRTRNVGDIPVHLSSAPLRLGADTVVRSVLLTDLREQRRTEAVVAAGQLAQRILDQASEAVVVCDGSGIIRQVNREALRLVGGVDPCGSPFGEAFALEGRNGRGDLDRLLAGQANRLPAQLHRPEGTVHLVVSASQLRGADGSALGSVVTLTDWTDLHDATQQLERHARRQRCTAELGRAALAGVPLATLADDCGEVLRELIEHAEVRMSGSFTQADAEEGEASRATGDDGIVRREIRTREGTVGTIEVDPGRGRAFSADDLGFIDSLVGVMSLAAEQQALHDRLHHQAHHDALTGLPNRVLLEDRLEIAIERARRDGTTVAVLFIDLDRFKHVNDTLGHQAGNDVLIQIGERIRRHVRSSDTVARIGGDEFTVIHGDLRSSEDAEGIADVLTDVLARPLTVAGHTVKVRATVGISTFPRDGADTETLLMKSDRAMYHGKSGGRNTVRFFNDHMNEFTTARLSMEHDFEEALTAGQLQLYFQPKVAPQTGAIHGLEALTRWKHPRHGWVPPARFVPIAESLGLVGELGAWALGRACRVAAPWAVIPSFQHVSVNISPAHIARPGFVEAVRAALEGGGLDPSKLELEVTESVMMHDVESVVGPLTTLRELGVSVALDDFGLGYSSFSSLRSLPLDRLKVDKSLVDTRSGQLGSRANQRAVLLGITTMAQALGLRVTIEGVETEAELEMARSVGCDEVQGFLLGAPAPPERVERLLLRGSVKPNGAGE